MSGRKLVALKGGSMVTATTSPIGSLQPTAPRRAWIDNLRVAIIVGVIGAHVTIIYALDVGWYYEERTAGAITKAVLAAIFSPGMLFGMGLMFFVAGLFTPPALARKGPRRFAIDRLWRLGLPTVAYLFIIDPAMNALGDRASGQAESVADYFRRTYWDDVEFGVAWFIAALLAFSLVYAAWRSRHPARPNDIGPLRRRDLLNAAVFIALASYVVRLVWPFLATDKVWGLNLWEYPQMVALFALGTLAEERAWLADGLPVDMRRACGRVALLGIGFAALTGVAITLTDDPDPWLGGLRTEATLIPVIEAMITVGMSLWAVDWFRRRWNRATPLVRRVGGGSFVAYLVHAPITVVLAVAIRDLDVPTEMKIVTVFALTVVASFGLGWLFTRSRPSNRVL